MDNSGEAQRWFEYAQNDSDFEKIINHCSDPTIYSSEVRYPNLLDIDNFHMQKALEDSEIIREFVLNKVSH